MSRDAKAALFLAGMLAVLAGVLLGIYWMCFG